MLDVETSRCEIFFSDGRLEPSAIGRGALSDSAAKRKVGGMRLNAMVETQTEIKKVSETISADWTKMWSG